MNNKIVIFELDCDEADAIIKVFRVVKLEKFFPEIVGDESAHEAMDAMQHVLKETLVLMPPKFIDLEEDFYSVSLELTNSQISELKRFILRLSFEDVVNWGYSSKVAKEVVNAIWCIKDGLVRAHQNIDQPLR